jgi:hypothetical protein
MFRPDPIEEDMVRLIEQRLYRHLPKARSASATLGVIVLGVLAMAGAGTALLNTPSHEGPPVLLRQPRVVILKARRTLHLFDSDRLVRSYPIELGTTPTGQKRRRDDGRTPIGRFRIVTKNAESKYHRFLGIDYPNEEALEWGLASGLISAGEARAIREALDSGRCPPWRTALGGGIGIHGHRVGHDWTGGCIALSDEHVEELFSVLRVGDPVEILP